uniref:7TM GPCR serpentine receptor class x (Srx) domain-containing protein n=1 Tax=Romanomermis culicivorax TaxID=13658 RepID=A0A915HYR5_ROMCU
MHTDKTMSTSNVYRIIIHMGYSDVLQLLFNGVPAGIYSILRDNRPVYFNKVLGAIVDGAWFAYVFLSQLLAANRFLYIFARHRVSNVFSDQKTKLLVAFCWLIVCCMVQLQQLCHDEAFQWMMCQPPGLYIIHAQREIKEITMAVNANSDAKDRKLLLQAFLLCFSDVLMKFRSEKSSVVITGRFDRWLLIRFNVSLLARDMMSAADDVSIG